MTELIEMQATPAGNIEDRFVIRPFALDTDLSRLVRLRNEMEAVDQTDNGISEDELRVRLTVPHSDPARDRWVVEEPDNPDRLIADSMTGKDPLATEGWISIWVHPDWRRQGLGSALLARQIARARELGAEYVTSGTNDRVPAGDAFLRKHGFYPTTTWINMQTPARLALAEPVWAAGYSVRTYAEVQDLPTLNLALNRGFIGHWGHHEGTEEELAHWLAAPTTRPDGIFLAFGPAGEVAGVCWAELNPELDKRRGVPTGYIDSLAVLPEHRRKGLGRALLLTGMRWLEAAGMQVYELGAWGENDMALPLYFGVGFQIAQKGNEYRLDY